ncbi:MAG: DMT family transporter [Erysipelotrichaceae bacterium]|nr:DMT family transporter [Erysipelotrichaceae bacterium]
MKQWMANGLLVLVTIIWGGGFIATAAALDCFSPYGVMMIRFLGASVLPLLLSIPAWKTTTKKQIKQGVIAGVLLFLAFAFQTIGLQYTTPSKSAFLTATYVIIVPYVLWLIQHRKPSGKDILASFICLTGIALLTLKGGEWSLDVGDVLSLVCAVFFAVHIIALESYTDGNVFLMTALQMLTAGIISAILALMFESWPNKIEPAAIGSVAYLILFSTMLAYLLQTFAQKYTNANSTAMILSMEALWATVFSFLLLKEQLSFFMILGAALIFLSILYMELDTTKKKE